MVYKSPPDLLHPIRQTNQLLFQNYTDSIPPSPFDSSPKIRPMELADIAGIQYLAQLTAMQNNIPALHIGRFLNPNPSTSLEIPPPMNELTSQSLSNNSTSGSSEDDHLSMINERKKRRMISNRESARRSRMRKQRHLDELWAHVVRLQGENRQLINNMNDMSEQCDSVQKENIRLREEASDLRQKLQDLQLNNPFGVLKDL